jgi:hypothetical protein
MDYGPWTMDFYFSRKGTKKTKKTKGCFWLQVAGYWVKAFKSSFLTFFYRRGNRGFTQRARRKVYKFILLLVLAALLAVDRRQLTGDTSTISAKTGLKI